MEPKILSILNDDGLSLKDLERITIAKGENCHKSIKGETINKISELIIKEFC